MNISILSLLTFLILSAKGPFQGNVPQWERKFLIKNDKNVILDVPFVHQIEDLSDEEKPKVRATACGPAALAMLFQFHGKEVDLEEVISKVPTSVYVKGERFYNLYKGADYFDMSSVKITNKAEDIFNTLQMGEPIILNVQNYDGITGHALVIVGMINFDGENAESLIIHDPYVGPYRAFTYEANTVLRQPEGYNNYMGHLDPFYLKGMETLLVLK